MINKDTKDYIISSYNSGKTVYKIADELNIATSSVYNVLNKAGIKVDSKRGRKQGVPQGPSPFKKNINLDDYNCLKLLGYSDTQIAEYFGMSRYTLTKRLKELRGGLNNETN